MTRIDLKRWIVGNEDASESGILAQLRDAETFGLTLITGIFRFLCHRIPHFVRVMIDWLRAKLLFGIRVAIRLVRVGAVFGAWAAIVVGPSFIYPGIICGLWVVLAVTGSVWGWRRHALKMRSSTPPAGKSPAELLEFLAHGK